MHTVEDELTLENQPFFSGTRSVAGPGGFTTAASAAPFWVAGTGEGVKTKDTGEDGALGVSLLGVAKAMPPAGRVAMESYDNSEFSASHLGLLSRENAFRMTFPACLGVPTSVDDRDLITEKARLKLLLRVRRSAVAGVAPRLLP